MQTMSLWGMEMTPNQIMIFENNAKYEFFKENHPEARKISLDDIIKFAEDNPERYVLWRKNKYSSNNNSNARKNIPNSNGQNEVSSLERNAEIQNDRNIKSALLIAGAIAAGTAAAYLAFNARYYWDKYFASKDSNTTK